MKKITIFLFFLFGSSFSQITQTTTFPDVYELRDIQFLDENVWITCGSGGLLARSRDAGSNWQIVPTGIEAQLEDIYATSNLNIYVCGRDASLFRSSDNGLNWRKINLPIPSNTKLLKIVAFSDDSLVIAGTDGIIVSTADGGNIWSVQTVTSRNIYDLKFFGGGMAFAVGEAGLILKSIDNGKSWSNFNLIYETSDFVKIIHLTSQYFLFVSKNGRIYKTIDGGSTWTLHNLNYIVDILDAHLLFDNKLLLILRSGVAIKTPVDNPFSQTETINPEDSPRLLINVYPKSETEYIATQTGASILRSTNNGRSWSTLLRSLKFENIIRIHFLDKMTGALITRYGIHGGVYVTTNGGFTWELRRYEYNDSPTRIEFSSDGLLYFASLHSIYRSSNLGISWSRLGGSGDAMRDMSTLPGGRAFAFAYKPGFTSFPVPIAFFYTSFNGALLNYSQLVDKRPDQVKFFDPSNGWMIADSSTFYFTINGGKNWVKFRKMFTPAVSYCNFVNNNLFFVTTARGRIYKSSDAGKSWVIRHYNPKIKFNFAHFIDENRGMVAGNNGTLMATTDGSASWKHITTFGKYNFTSVQLFDDGSFIAGTDNGELFKGNIITGQGRIEDAINVVETTEEEESVTNSLSEDERSFNVTSYPNPFSIETTVSFSLPEAGLTNLEIFDVTGRSVKTVIDDIFYPKGDHRIKIQSTELPSGIYFYRLVSGKYSAHRKIIVLK